MARFKARVKYEVYCFVEVDVEEGGMLEEVFDRARDAALAKGFTPSVEAVMYEDETELGEPLSMVVEGLGEEIEYYDL